MFTSNTFIFFSANSHGPSVTSEGVSYPALARANVAGNLQNQIPVLPSTSLTLVGESLRVCLQHTVKYSTEIRNWNINMALLSEEENHEIWKQSGHIWHCYTRLISSVFHHCSVFVQRLCWNCAASGLEAAMSVAVLRSCASHSTALCRRASSLPVPWNPTCKTGTMVWPIKHTDAVSNTFWQYCKVSLELSVVMKARWIMQMFEHSCKTAQSLHLFPQSG